MCLKHLETVVDLFGDAGIALHHGTFPEIMMGQVEDSRNGAR